MNFIYYFLQDGYFICPDQEAICNIVVSLTFTKTAMTGFYVRLGFPHLSSAEGREL
jgi:hypothetical protein